MKELFQKEPIHDWFELSYAQYLTIPRSVLQSMPIEWQETFVKCLTELDETIDWRPKHGCYRCQLMDYSNVDGFEFEWLGELYDPFADYECGKTIVSTIKNNQHPA